MNMNDTVDVVELRARGYGVEKSIVEEEMLFRNSMELTEFRDYEKRRLVMLLEAYAYGKEHPERHVIRYPENWLEAVKERFAPVWIRDRWPVRFVEVSASLEETYPDIQPCMPDRNPVMRFAVLKKIVEPVW